MSDKNQLEKLKELEKYLNSFDNERRVRWINVSHVASQYDPFMVITIQGLGDLDSKLVVEDRKIVDTEKSFDPTSSLSVHFTNSYLWVLGAYEIVRCLSQHSRNSSSFFYQFKKEIDELKMLFTRIRIPLAKFEPAGKFKLTDSDIAYPSLHHELGVSWQVAENVHINRFELSDKLLILLEFIRGKLV
ncbi:MULTISPECIES: hypothetical protein [Pseudoalteromonas]|jgi:hypothetical protein|uniref:hypothetical protein n=1 Tax=Pseudoalteromonas sp. T1lg21 TaxID=2077095 RepID=UPI000CF6EA28|nr:hypothetical protein [Pseudoalteromonas sp. T1lg21]